MTHVGQEITFGLVGFFGGFSGVSKILFSLFALGNILFDGNETENLGNRNLNYSLLDQVIIGVHMHTPEENQYILNTFNKCKIINIYPYDSFGDQIIRKLAHAKLKNKIIDLDYTNNIDYTNNNSLNSDPRIINIPFGCLFNEELFEKTYKNIINFLDLPGKLIRYDFIKYYLSKQQNGMDKELIDYSTLLNKNMNNIH